MLNIEQLREMATASRAAARVLAQTTLKQRNEGLLAMACALQEAQTAILAANEEDLAAARLDHTPEALLDRLRLTSARLRGIAGSLRELADLPDPIGTIEKSWRGAQEIAIEKLRVPLGVIAAIYEARPNVTVDIAGICIKTGNAIILRGSKNALKSNICLTAVLRRALADCGLPADSVQLIEDTEREVTNVLMRLNGYIDLLIPRGGAGLIKTVVENSSVPVIETGTGKCHIYLHQAGDIKMAQSILINAKCQRPSVCNAAEGLLVDEKIAAEAVPALAKVLAENQVELRGCSKTCALTAYALPAQEQDYYEEFLRLVISCKVVSGLREAIDWINEHGSSHSEVIVTEDTAAAGKFLAEVDAAAVYHNASSRFTDGGQFGFGAEIGISTQKLHARGPMGLEAVTSYKYLIHGQGQTRK